MDSNNGTPVDAAIHKRAALYVVAPTSEAMDAQAAELNAFTREHTDWVGQEYRETSSARPGLRRLQDDVEHSKVEVVVIKTIAALAPSGVKALRIARAFSRKGVVVHSVAERWFDPSDPLVQWIVKDDRRRQEKSIKALEARRQRGEATGTPGLGLRRDENGVLVDDEDEQGLIDRVLELHAQNLSFGYIALIVTNEGHRSRQGTALTHTQISRIIRRWAKPDE
jgi:DNA invertase Pin-like site-specific DNA recombinase